MEKIKQNNMVIYHLIGVPSDFKNHTLIGTFDSIVRVVKMMEDCPSSILSYGSYDWMVIEKYILNDIDCECFGDVDFETWYRVIDENTFHLTEKPDELFGVYGLSHKCVI